jgi:glycosyltransferase involved in cell wall biosynthesis
MRICYVITRFKGGAKNYVRCLAESVEGDVTIVCGPDSNRDELESLDVETTVIIPWLRHWNPVALFIAVFSLFRIFVTDDFDIIHTNSTEAGWVGRIAGGIAGIPVVHTEHGLPWAGRHALVGWWIRCIERLAAYCGSLMIAISPTIQERYEKYGLGVGKHVVVPLGIDVDRFSEVDPVTVGDGFTVVTVARLVDGKGIGRVLDVADQCDDISFVIVGDGPLRSLEDEAPENVTFTGYRDDIPAILSGADVFLLLSSHEGTPLVIYEAMAAGLPVISTDVGGISDQVDHGTTGFLVGGGTAAIERLYELKDSDELRDRLGARGRERVLDVTVDRMVRETEAVYVSLGLNDGAGDV